MGTDSNDSSSTDVDQKTRDTFYQTKEEIVCGSSTTAAAFAHWGSKIALSV